ncbi:MAG TPA: hypothetical protein VGD04_00920 [Methylophilus sp.]
MNWKTLLFVTLIAYGAYQHFANRAVTHTPGEIASQAPQQTSTNTASFIHHGYTITPLENFTLAARVLGREYYRLDRGAKLSPVDLALGWGPMSDETVLSNIQISQGNRFYYWRAATLPIPQQQIETHSANMHMIPASDDVEDILHAVKVGQKIQLQGYLVKATSDDGFTWKSSLTREDTGFGACELVYVTQASIAN